MNKNEEKSARTKAGLGDAFMLASVPGTPQIIGYIMPVATMSAALAVIRVKKIRADNK